MALALVLVLTLAGCAGSGAGDGASQSAASAASAVPLPEVDPNELARYAGYYVCEDELAAKPEFYPSLDLYLDGVFSLNVNLFESMGQVMGQWRPVGGVLQMTVNGRSFEGFLGDDVEAFSFQVVEGEEGLMLYYHGEDIGMTQQGAIFEQRERPSVMGEVEGDADSAEGEETEASAPAG